MKNLHPWEKSWDTSILSTSTQLTDPLQETMDSYMKALKQDVLEAELNSSCKIKFTYSAMHGVGYTYMAEAFRTANFQVQQYNIKSFSTLFILSSIVVCKLLLQMVDELNPSQLYRKAT
jgi:phosphomannomutase